MIFYLSSLPSLESGFSEPVDFLFRKTGHVVVYLILTLLIARALQTGHGMSNKKAYIYAMLAALLYAITDEWHQHFISGRHGRVRDVVLDAIGIAIVWFRAIRQPHQQPS